MIISKDLKVSKQCGTAVKKGFQILGLTSRSFVCKKKSLLVSLYKTLIRPHLDYCMQAWRPHLQKDIVVLERVQRRATRMIEECKKLEYEDRLRKVGLTTLETRRVRGDLIEVFKSLNKLENVEEREFFERCSGVNVVAGTSRTRGNVFKLNKKKSQIGRGQVRIWKPNCR